jgi:hypothetical protein
MGTSVEIFYVVFAVLLVWGLFALGTQGSQSTKKKPGDKLSDRGVTLTQSLFWITIFIFILIGIGAMVSGG